MDRIEVTLRDVEAAVPVVREVAFRTPTIRFSDPVPRSELLRVHEEEAWRALPETYLPPFAHPLMVAGHLRLGW